VKFSVYFAKKMCITCSWHFYEHCNKIKYFNKNLKLTLKILKSNCNVLNNATK